jgi:hypothetical protein
MPEAVALVVVITALHTPVKVWTAAETAGIKALLP